jgi:hypothetical protein
MSELISRVPSQDQMTSESARKRDIVFEQDAVAGQELAGGVSSLRRRRCLDGSEDAELTPDSAHDLQSVRTRCFDRCPGDVKVPVPRR